MKRSLRVVPGLVALLFAGLLPACGDGPSGSPEGSLDTFIDCATKKKWVCCINLVDPELVKKRKNQIGNDIINRWDGLFNHEYVVHEVNVAGNYATIQISESYDRKGIDARDIRATKERYDAWSAIELDGLWYLRPPGSEKIVAF